MQVRRFVMLGSIVAGIALVSAGVWGCKDKDTNPVSATLSELALADAAEVVADAAGADNGGAIDQIQDALDLTIGGGIRMGEYDGGLLAKAVAFGDSGVYDQNTGWWTVTISRSRSSMSGTFSASFERVYQYQFLNKNGQALPWRVFQGDTAVTMHFKVLSGSGTHITPRISHRLVSLTSDFTIIDLNRDTVTVNGTSSRHGIDTLTTRNAVRTSDHTLDMTFSEIKSLKPTPMRRMRPDQDISGTITGRYQASITFLRGELYQEKTVDRTFTIDLASDSSHISIGGKRFRFYPGWGQLGNP